MQWFEAEPGFELIWAVFGLGLGPGSQSEVVILIVSHWTLQEVSLLGYGPQTERAMGLDVLSAVQRALLGFGPQAEMDPAPVLGAGFLSGAGTAQLEFHWIPFEAARGQPEVEEGMAVPALLRAFGLSEVLQEL